MADYYIGLMSGTSLDSIDAALVDLSLPIPKLCATYQQSWDPDFQQNLLQISQGETQATLAQLLELDTLAAQAFSRAVKSLLQKSGIKASAITAIGSHGQTLYHQPPTAQQTGNSWQIGNAHLIAAQTGITTVADFRRADMAVGGQGAPLVPAFHQLLFNHSPLTAVLNIGGIANLSLLKNSDQSALQGFDSGPGNCLLNAWIQQQQGHNYDHNGAWAAQGVIDKPLLKYLLNDKYFQKPTPKSSGRDYFNLSWLQQYPRLSAITAVNVQATLLALTVKTITDLLAPQPLQQLLVCGGGVHNQALMTALQQQLNYPVDSTAIYQIDPDWIEASCFAWLAQQCLLQQTANSPAVTGAKQAVILGAIYQ